MQRILLVDDHAVVRRGVRSILEDNMSAFFPIFRLGAQMSLIAVAIATAVGVLAAALPSFSASRVKIVDALRHVA